MTDYLDLSIFNAIPQENHFIEPNNDNPELDYDYSDDELTRIAQMNPPIGLPVEWIPITEEIEYYVTIIGKWFNKKHHIWIDDDGQKYFISNTNYIYEIPDSENSRKIKRDECDTDVLDIIEKKRKINE